MAWAKILNTSVNMMRVFYDRKNVAQQFRDLVDHLHESDLIYGTLDEKLPEDHPEVDADDENVLPFRIAPPREPRTRTVSKKIARTVVDDLNEEVALDDDAEDDIILEEHSNHQVGDDDDEGDE